MSSARFILVSWMTLSVLLAACQRPPHFNSRDISGVAWGGDFSLTASTGQTQRLSDYRGKVVVLFFGYTHCADICTPTLSKLAALHKRMGADTARLQVLFVTLDPEHDTPAQIKTFLAAFDPSFIGFTGSPAAVHEVAGRYKIGYRTDKSGTIDHSGSIFMIDRAGRLRLLVPNDLSIDAMTQDVKTLVRE